ncbi:MAG: PASTA domain-containing protein, partial [Gemmatimonadaceae bacterium]
AAESVTVAPARASARALAAERAAADTAGPTPFVATLPAPRASRTVAMQPRVVPDVRGLSLRQAVLALHSAGFRVKLAAGTTSDTWPAAGSLAPVGSTVQLTGAQ